MEPSGCVNSFPNSYKWVSDNGYTGTTSNIASANPITKPCAAFLIQPLSTNIKWVHGNFYRVIKQNWIAISYNFSKSHCTFAAHGGTTYTWHANAISGNEHMTMH